MMSNNDNGDLFGHPHNPKNELLDELGSLKALLDEDTAQAPPVTSVSEIGSVKEYMLLKQQAKDAGLTLDEYLQQRAHSSKPEASSEQAAEEDDIPMLDEVVELNDLPPEPEAADDFAAQAEEAIPTLDEVYEVVETAAGGDYSLEEVERMVHQLVSQKLEEIRPQLEKQLFDQVRNMLPVDLFK